ncbi:hypothetical protein CDAR_77121 [Caerostris darwini]|uniref:Ycf15 n=1 Tax=Caerostris darwini TaxID=1538125 RepID=A0AAV4SIN4_9ARAC|nr:hypothetical protein CDAR_77121 [Caerostris darwini]
MLNAPGISSLSSIHAARIYHRSDLYVNCTKDDAAIDKPMNPTRKDPESIERFPVSPNLCWVIISFPVKRTGGEAFSRKQEPLFSCRRPD